MNTIPWGATGQAIVLRELLEAGGDEIVALFDDNPRVRSPFEDVPLYYGLSGFEAWLRDRGRREVQGFAAIGGERGADRLEVCALLSSHGVRLGRAVHRSAFVAGDASLGEGVQIMAHATICARAIIGDAALVNTSASVDHECIIERAVHLGPGAVLAGCVLVEECAFIGAGAVVLPRLRIGAGSIVGAGAVVTKDVPPSVTVSGNPARLHRHIDMEAR